MVDFTGNMPLIPDLIQILIDPPKQELKLELTIDQKIKSNFYKCDTEIQWIWAQDATCHDKHPTYTQSRTRTPRNQSQGYYQAGQCTAWVASHRYVPDGWGDATDWKWHAQQAGWTVSSKPVKGAIAWTYGHVAYVVSVNSTTVTISEANYDWHGSVRTIDRPISYFTYIY